jgi:hypothetical protein
LGFNLKFCAIIKEYKDHQRGKKDKQEGKNANEKTFSALLSDINHM